MLLTASGDASDRTGDRDHLGRLRVWVWLVALLLLIGLVVFWLAQAVPEEYAKLRARASDDRYAVRAEGLAAALAQYHRHVGVYPENLEDRIAPTVLAAIAALPVELPRTIDQQPTGATTQLPGGSQIPQAPGPGRRILPPSPSATWIWTGAPCPLPGAETWSRAPSSTTAPRGIGLCWCTTSQTTMRT